MLHLGHWWLTDPAPASLINELGSGHRISLAKLGIDFLPRHSRPPRVAIDVSIWLFQAQAGRGGANPELRTLFYRLQRLVALPIHPLFVFDGPEKPEYKRGKLVCRSENAAAYVIRLAKRLIELFKFPWHVAPGEAEAECAKLESEGVMDAVMSDDVDAVMFGSRVTLRNFSKDVASGTKAATHVNVCRTADTPDGEVNMSLDQGGMILFAMLSGGDYLPAGVPKCGPKLAGEIARAKFGTDLLEIIRENSPNMREKLDEWRERLRYELQTNESGYFKSKHKAVQIPDSFPDRRILFDYVCPVTSSRTDLKKLCGRWVWDRELDAQQLRVFICEELGWNYLLGAKRLIRTIAPQLVSQRLRLGDAVVSDNTRLLILRQRENFGMEGMSELKLQFVPSDVVKLDLEPLGSQRSEPADTEEEDSEEDQEENVGTSRKPRYQSYDPSQPDSAWISEAIVKMGLPDMVASWHAEQKKKELAKSRSSNKSASRRKGAPKVLDPTMTPGAILRFGTIVKGPAESPSSKKSPNFARPPDDIPASSGRSPGKNRPAAGPNVKNTSTRERSKMGSMDATSNNIGASMDFVDREEGIPPPPSPAPKFRDPNSMQSFARFVDGLDAAITHPSSARAPATGDPHENSHTCPSTNKTAELLFPSTAEVTSKRPNRSRRRSPAGPTDASVQRIREPRQAKKGADQEPSAQSALKSPSKVHGSQTAKPGQPRSPKAKSQPSRVPPREAVDTLQEDGDDFGKKQMLDSKSTDSSNTDQINSPTRRRISGIIETHNGTWTQRPKTRDQDTSSTQSAASKGAGANSSRPSGHNGKSKPQRSKRITRVSILDLS